MFFFIFFFFDFFHLFDSFVLLLNSIMKAKWNEFRNELNWNIFYFIITQWNKLNNWIIEYEELGIESRSNKQNFLFVSQTLQIFYFFDKTTFFSFFFLSVFVRKLLNEVTFKFLVEKHWVLSSLSWILFHQWNEVNLNFEWTSFAKNQGSFIFFWVVLSNILKEIRSKEKIK